MFTRNALRYFLALVLVAGLAWMAAEIARARSILVPQPGVYELSGVTDTASTDPHAFTLQGFWVVVPESWVSTMPGGYTITIPAGQGSKVPVPIQGRLPQEVFDRLESGWLQVTVPESWVTRLTGSVLIETPAQVVAHPAYIAEGTTQ